MVQELGASSAQYAPERIAAFDRIIDRHCDGLCGAGNRSRHHQRDAEIAQCLSKPDPVASLAGRFAAKEAVMKALGTGFIQGTHFQEIEVVTEESGRPRIVLHGSTANLAKQLGIGEILVTMSHCREYATATAIGISEK